MMLVMEVVLTALLLVAIAAAQKPTTIGDASVDVNEQVRNNGPVLGTLLDQAEVPPDKGPDYKKYDIIGKDLDSEEYSDEFEDDDSDSYESEEANGEDEEEVESNERVKRKVIFRGGSSGGIYSRGGRRGGGGADDPYGRRRGHPGPDYGPQESWPYRRSDTPYVETPTYGTTGAKAKDSTGTGAKAKDSTGTGAKAKDSTGTGAKAKDSTGKSESAPVYGTTHTTSSDVGTQRSTGTSSSSTYGGKISNASGREDSSKRTKTERRETAKTKLPKNLKWEIAQYAMQHGSQRAVDHFEGQVGRKLRVKKVDKFVKRYQSKSKM